MKEGVFKQYFKDGTVSCVGEYVNGERSGEWKYYLRSGLVKAIGCYDQGKMTGAWTEQRIPTILQ